MKVSSNTKAIKLQFKNAVDLQQTCKIYMTTPNDSSWSFYFQKGWLIWATSSVHRFGRLYRLTNKVCPQINCQDVKLREQEISELWEYLLISVLHQRKQISFTQAEIIIQESIKEVIIDCFLASDRIDKIKAIFETEGNGMGAILRSPLFKEPITTIDYKRTIRILELLISDWKNLDLHRCTPNYAPVIKDIDKFSKTVDSKSYKQLLYLIDGKKTLRDLAFATKQDIISLTCSLIPHLQNRIISLQAIPDRQLKSLYFSPSHKKDSKTYNNSKRVYLKELDLPLIVIVDDNPRTCQKITQILNPAGYRVISVNDAGKALIVLLENQPNLIFLDALMADANGYELCSQIRKMPALKDVPIIIWHSKKGMMDTVKAKMSGASELVEKPIKVQDALMLAQKYTQSIVEQNDLATS